LLDDAGGGSVGAGPIDPKTQCCENGKIVSKVPIWICERPLHNPTWGYLGDKCSILLPKTKDLQHSYVCCNGPNQRCYGKQSKTPIGIDPITKKRITRETKKGDPIPIEPYQTGDCKMKMVCPSAKKKKCENPKAEHDYKALGQNCHKWAWRYVD